MVESRDVPEGSGGGGQAWLQRLLATTEVRWLPEEQIFLSSDPRHHLGFIVQLCRQPNSAAPPNVGPSLFSIMTARRYSNPSPPPFPMPSHQSPPIDELSVQMQNMRVNRHAPPVGPPPGWTGGFNLPLSTLQQHDPYHSDNRRQGSPVQIQPSPVRVTGPSMPVPSPYIPSNSDPALPMPSRPNKPANPNRRRSSATPGPGPSSSDPDVTSPPKASRPPPRRRSTALEGSPDTQCSGTTKAGARCNRIVREGPPAAMYLDPEDPEGPIERFCHQHRKDISEQTAFPSGRVGVGLVKFGEWISDDLMEETKVALKSAMAKRVSDADKNGQIYCFQILNDDTPGYVHFKVGRTNNFVRRTGEWGRQCTRHEQILRGVWPEDETITSLKGRMGGEGKTTPYSHRLEKLIHLEMSDRSKALLEKAADVESNPRKGKLEIERVRMSGKTCECGRIHKEIFTFPKAKGKGKEQEWQDIVFPVIKLWGTFVETCL